MDNLLLLILTKKSIDEKRLLCLFPHCFTPKNNNDEINTHLSKDYAGQHILSGSILPVCLALGLEWPVSAGIFNEPEICCAGAGPYLLHAV